MSERIIIAAQSENRVIGQGGGMPWHLPRDLKFFKAHTLGHPVIMGRKTYQSLRKALPARENIVISRSVAELPDARVCAALPQALALADALHERVFIIGGSEVYHQALAADVVDTLLITWVETQLSGDALFPVIEAQRWRLLAEERAEADADNAYALRFCRYERIR